MEISFEELSVFLGTFKGAKHFYFERKTWPMLAKIKTQKAIFIFNFHKSLQIYFLMDTLLYFQRELFIIDSGGTAIILNCDGYAHPFVQ